MSKRNKLHSGVLHPPPSEFQQRRQCAGHLWQKPGTALAHKVHPEYNATASGRGDPTGKPDTLIRSTNPTAVSLRGLRREVPPAD
ncbi:hypothetical protein TNCV_3210501 [Trichonephila clavipes]|nr:hypothetical protein TNCV_3210501 [Trichonephila clavipes]